MLFLPLEGEKYEQIASIAVRTIMRIIDADVCVGRGYLAKRREIQNGALQEVTGEAGFTTGFVGRGNALCKMATAYADEIFNVVDEDALDAIGEVTNCINGLCATAREHLDSSLELCPPEYSAEVEAVVSVEMLVLPLRILGKKVDYVIALGNRIELK